LSLGQGLYFGIGGYLVGYSLILQKAAMEEDLPRYEFGPNMALPPFMFQNRLTEVPGWIAPLINIWTAVGLAVLLPMILAAAFGWVVFQRRIKGVYFSLITQALVLAVFHLVTNQMPYTGGEGGLYNLAILEIFGREFKPFPMFILITSIVVFFALLCYALMNSKMGKILTAIRDNEFRVMALGYNTAMYKTFIFALAGLMAGLAGALFVAANRTAGPTFFSIAESIEVVIFVAVGGRGTLAGPILGALLVSEGKDYINEHFRDIWPIILGGLFVSVVLFLPEGILGGIPRFVKFLRLWFYRRAGLTRSWNTLRVGIGLMYWGILLIVVGVVLRFIMSHTKSGGGEADPVSEPEINTWLQWLHYWFGWLFASSIAAINWFFLTGGMILGGAMALVGLGACLAAPSETSGKKYVIGTLVCLGACLIAGLLALSAPVEEIRLIFGLRGFGEVGALLLGFLGCAFALSYLFFGLFLRGIALVNQNETLARSVRGFIILFFAFLASTVFLNSMSGEAWQAALHPVLARFLFIAGLAYSLMLLVLAVWFLKLLYQTHESINRPMAAA
jgi:urea transport system permease protein